MTSTMARIILFSFLFLLFIPHLTSAETKTFIKEYTYQASEVDSKVSCRTIALEQVKRLLLEELGTYLESITEVQNFQLTKDQITTLTAGIVKTEIVEEKWDGRAYWLKANIKADSKSVVKSIDVLRKDREQSKALEETRRRSDELLMENERLRKELATATGAKKQEQEAAYNKTIKELAAIAWSVDGKKSAIFGRNKAAINELNKAIELDPENAAAYYWRGVVYEKLGNYTQAINDYSKVIEINPKSRLLFHAYRNRGRVYTELGNYLRAIQDYDKWLEINPKDADAYKIRGYTYTKLDNYVQAIKDCDKAIELYIFIAQNPPGTNPVDGLMAEVALGQVYHNRGVAYQHLGNYNQTIQNYKEAAKWGSKEAQDYLKKKRISW